MTRQRLMMWCLAAAVLTPTAAAAQHGKDTKHAESEVAKSAKHDEHAAAEKPEKESHEAPKATKAGASAASDHTTSSKERSSRLSRSKRAKPSAAHEAEAEHVVKSEPPAAKSEHGARAAKVASATDHKPAKDAHGAEKPDQHVAERPDKDGTASKSPRTTRSARASRASKRESADANVLADAHVSADEHAAADAAARHETRENEQVAKAVSTRSGASTHALEESMERINAKVEAIKAASPAPAPAKRAPAKRSPAKRAPARAKAAAPAHDAPIVWAAPPPTEPTMPRLRLQWRTVLDWPMDLHNELEIPARADVPRIALSWTAK